MNLKKINAHIYDLPVDYLYHLGINTSMNIDALFGDIRYVIFSRLNSDIAIFAQEFARCWYGIKEDAFAFKPLFKTERYHLYKIGPVLAISHGVGAQSMLICLNEIAKLVAHLKITNITFFKLGPAGGLNVTPGEIVLGDKTVNYQFQSLMTGVACGETYQCATPLNDNLLKKLQKFFIENHVSAHVGSIMTASDYYEGQGRMNGFLPTHYLGAEVQHYWQKALMHNVKSIDMESLYFAGFCNALEIVAGVVNHIVVDRLSSDDILMTSAEQESSQRRASHNLSRYLVENYHEN